MRERRAQKQLSKVEFAVLKLFMESPNRVFTKAHIYAGWEEEYYQNENSIRVIINRIRAIIGSERIQRFAAWDIGLSHEKLVKKVIEPF